MKTWHQSWMICPFDSTSTLSEEMSPLASSNEMLYDTSELTEALLLSPPRAHNSRIELDMWHQFVLLCKTLKVFPDLGSICIEAGPVGIWLEAISVCVGGSGELVNGWSRSHHDRLYLHVACATRVTILVPEVSSISPRMIKTWNSGWPLYLPSTSDFWISICR